MSAWWFNPVEEDGATADRIGRFSFCPECCTGNPPPTPCACTLWENEEGPCCYEIRFSGFTGDQSVWNGRAFHVQFVSEGSSYGATGCTLLGTICNPATNLRHLLRIFVRVANIGETGPYVLDVRIGGLLAFPWSDGAGSTSPEYRWTRQLAEKPGLNTSFVGLFVRTVGAEGSIDSVTPTGDCTTEEWCTSCACYHDLPQFMLIEIAGVGVGCGATLNNSFLAELSDLDSGSYHSCVWRYSFGPGVGCAHEWFLETVGSDVVLYCKASSSSEAAPVAKWESATPPTTPWRCDTVSGNLLDVPTSYFPHTCTVAGSTATVTAIP